jgi:hypothetical protein
MTPQRWDGGSARPDPPGAFLLWPAIYFVTVGSLLLGLYSTSVPNWYFGLAFLTFVTCVAIAGFWAYGFGTTINNARGRLPARVLLRWVGIPVAGYLSIALVFFNVPATVRFDLSRQAMENAAAVRLYSGSVYGAGWIGLMPVDEVRLDEDGTVIFIVNSDGLFGGCGYAYNPKASPTDDGAGLTGQIAPGWWTWCEPWMD